ncbi:NUDIX domain-containing protein [Halalkalibacter urbisdiaboli]|uniref:NUDIX domain-containing protein n=1 Tax=Halalkalibacter urbisdiaboli TaxID=1960589 RepID=UPI00315B0611
MPLLRAEGIIINNDRTKILVQCDLAESFYRFPGGGIEFGETASEAIKRELIEEFDLEIDVGNLACINESIVEYDGKKRHDCTLIHWCSGGNKVKSPLIHNERTEVQLVWRNIEQLEQKITYPEGIIEFISSGSDKIKHLIVKKCYK